MLLPEVRIMSTRIKSIIEISRKIIEMNEDLAINEKALELLNIANNVYSDMFLLQSKYDELIESNRVLENKLMELKI